MERLDPSDRRRSRPLWITTAGVAIALLLCAGVVTLVALHVNGHLEFRADGCERVDLTMPQPDRVSMGVFERSDHPGRELDVFVALGQRGFQMLESGSVRPSYPGVAVIRFGPKAVGAAQVVRAQIAEAEMTYEPTLKSDRVYLYLGEKFANLLTEDEAEHQLAELGSPQPPPNAC